MQAKASGLPCRDIRTCFRSEYSTMARIASIERTWVEMPLKETPWRNMVREIAHWRLFEVCRVELDTGQVGVGETMPYYTWGEVTDEAVERAEGADPVTIMWDDTLGAGLQMAIFDAVGQLLETPAWALMGTRRRTHAHVGWWAIDMPVEDWILECEQAAEAGYTTFKTKARPWFDLEDQVQRLSDAIPDYFLIDMDFNDFGNDPSVAKTLCKRLEKYEKVAIWESPIQQEDVEGNVHLRSHLAVPIAHHTDRPAFRTQLSQDICDGFVMDGGAANAHEKGRICEEFNKPFWLQWVGTNLAANYCLHVQAALSHARWPAIHCNHMFEEQYVKEPWVVSNGMVEIPDRPGIGVTIDWDVIEKYRIEPMEKPYPHPGLLIEVSWPSGDRTYFTHAQQMWDTWRAGDLPAFVRGVDMKLVEDDGSDQWRELQQQAQLAPVRTSANS